MPSMFKAFAASMDCLSSKQRLCPCSKQGVMGCRLEAMRAAQFSSRGATPHEEQALLKQAKALAAQQETGQPSRGKGSRGRSRGAASNRPAAPNAPESPQPAHAGPKTTQPSQGTLTMMRRLCILHAGGPKCFSVMQATTTATSHTSLQALLVISSCCVCCCMWQYLQQPMQQVSCHAMAS